MSQISFFHRPLPSTLLGPVGPPSPCSTETHPHLFYRKTTYPPPSRIRVYRCTSHQVSIQWTTSRRCHGLSPPESSTHIESSCYVSSRNSILFGIFGGFTYGREISPLSNPVSLRHWRGFPPRLSPVSSLPLSGAPQPPGERYFHTPSLFPF